MNYYARLDIDVYLIMAGIVAAAVGVALSAFAFVLVQSYRARKRAEAKERPPGPKGHWLLGNVLQLGNPATDPHLDLLLYEWMLQYGDVFQFWVPVVGHFTVVGCPQAARRIVSTVNYPKSPTYRPLAPLMGRGSIVMAEGEAWRRQRHAFNPGFSPKFLKGMLGKIAECTEVMCGLLEEHSRRKEPFRIHPMLTRMTGDIICSVAFNHNWHLQTNAHHPIGQALLIVTEICTNRLINPLYQYFNVAATWRLWRAARKLDGAMRQVVQERQAAVASAAASSAAGEGLEERCSDILSLMLALQCREAGAPAAGGTGEADMEMLISNLKAFFFAGHDTTSTLLSWSLYLLAQHPAVERKAVAEIRSVLRQGGAEAEPKMPSYEELEGLEYVGWVLKEVLRLYPPGSSARFLSDPSDRLQGFRVAPSVGYVNTYLLHRNPKYWALPNSFIPERWSPESQELDPIHEWAYMPFMRGPRDCIGRHFAMLEARAVLCMFLQRFTFTAVSDSETIQCRVTSVPMHGVELRVSRRG